MMEGNELDRLLVREVKDYAVFALDPHGHVRTWNEGARLLKGYEPHEIEGRHFAVFYTSEDQAAGKPQYEMEMAAKHGRFEDESWRVRKDGSRFWANEIITALRDNSGTLTGFTKISRDLSERKRMEEALRESVARYRTIVESARDFAIFLLDADNRIASWNPGAERITGYAASDAIGRSGSMIFTPEDLSKGDDKKELRTAEAEGRAEDDRWHVRKDGSLFWASGFLTALRDDAGRITGYFKIFRDATRQKRADEQLREMNEMLEQRVSERTAALVEYQRQLRSLVGELGRTEQRERRWLATELHDNLIQLLGVIKMKVQTTLSAQQGAGGTLPNDDDLTNDLDQAIQYTRHLMTDLAPVILSDEDLPGAVQWAAERVERLGLRVRVEDDGQPKPLDEDVLALLFESARELLLNVAKHAGTDEAQVALERRDGKVTVTVTDAGKGFDGTRALDGSRTGAFGLLSIRERLDLLGGTFELQSAPAKGTRISLIAPIRE